MQQDEDDRFGISAQALALALQHHRHHIKDGDGATVPVFRAGMLVPTRQDVATIPPARVLSVLLDWMWESPSELIPTNAMIAEVLAVLAARPDAAAVQQAIVACREYLDDASLPGASPPDASWSAAGS